MEYLRENPRKFPWVKKLNVSGVRKTLAGLTPLRVGTDCSGIEAPLQALEIFGLPLVHEFSCDNDPRVRESIRCNYRPRRLYNDILTRDHSRLPKLDLYVAGFPCQAFSHLGFRGGFYDYKGRGLIFFECAETIRQTEPEIFLLENVKGLVTHDGGHTFATVLDVLHKLQQWDIYYEVLNTRDYGLPQNRERVYIVGLKKGRFAKFIFPSPIPLETTFQDLIESGLPHTPLTPHKIQIIHDLQKRGMNLNDDWLVNLNCSSHLRSSPMKDVCPCLMASGAIYYLTSERRNLTPTEFLRLQGFHRFRTTVLPNHVYSQAGNSMSVPVICFILQQVFLTIRNRTMNIYRL
ncbi:MAG: DNA (cytosine-5-)-methyltransferase [Sulfobacillus sp.]